VTPPGHDPYGSAGGPLPAVGYYPEAAIGAIVKLRSRSIGAQRDTGIETVASWIRGSMGLGGIWRVARRPLRTLAVSATLLEHNPADPPPQGRLPRRPNRVKSGRGRYRPPETPDTPQAGAQRVSPAGQSATQSHAERTLPSIVTLMVWPAKPERTPSPTLKL
jgi:hypothetical protein